MLNNATIINIFNTDNSNIAYIKGSLSGLRQFLATKSFLKMMKSAFYFTSEALFVLKIFKFSFGLFGHV